MEAYPEIVVVDDALAETLQLILTEKVGARVAVAGNNEQARRALMGRAESKEPVDLVWTDHNRPGGSGLELIKWIRGMDTTVTVGRGLLLAKVPVIMCSGMPPPESEFTAEMEAGGLLRLLKPVSINKVTAAVDRILREYRHRVLSDLTAVGAAVVWEGGRLRVHIGALAGGPGSKYFGKLNDTTGEAYARLTLVSQRLWRAGAAIEEFEYLINKPGIGEVELHKFFLRHPEFLYRSEYDSYWSETHLTSPQDGARIRPDLILQPSGTGRLPWHWNILELKRADAPVLPSRRFHAKFSAEVVQGIEQLRDYQEFFRNPANASLLRKRFGGIVPDPNLTLLIGRRPSDMDRFGVLLRRQLSVRIVTYDDVLEWRRADVDRLTRLRT